MKNFGHDFRFTGPRTAIDNLGVLYGLVLCITENSSRPKLVGVFLLNCYTFRRANDLGVSYVLLHPHAGIRLQH